MNKAGFDALYREHYARVLGHCRRMLGSSADAEDAVQEVFMRGFRARAQYRESEPYGAWIGTIATNYCIDVLRRQRRLAGLFSDLADAEQEGHPGLTDPRCNGVEALISAHEAGAISQAVEALPERYRLPIVLAYYADASYEEIANALEITPNHVGVLLLRGRQQLRRDLTGRDRTTNQFDEER
jgi:RNA polymerase sigma-70 factor (ECF subfamily)